MPAVLIRQLEALTKIMDDTQRADQRELLLRQAEMIRQVSEESVPEAADRADVQREFDNLLAAAGRMDRAAAIPDRAGQAANR
jgi:hypothetical protein